MSQYNCAVKNTGQAYQLKSDQPSEIPSINESDVNSQPGADLRKIASRARWRQLYIQRQNEIVFRNIGGETSQKRHWLMTNGGYSRS